MQQAVFSLKNYSVVKVMLDLENIPPQCIYGAQNETYIEGWEKKASNLLIYKRLCKI